MNAIPNPLPPAALMVAVLLICIPTQAESAKTPKPCEGPMYDSFNFWIGKWTVTSPARPNWSANSSITMGNNGCSIHEAYQSVGGYTGNSINFYDRNDRKWHQTWIDNQGDALYLTGGLVDGRMVLGDASNRITWSVEPNGIVRQFWETTSDKGQTWAVAFDGYYQQKTPGKE